MDVSGHSGRGRAPPRGKGRGHNGGRRGPSPPSGRGRGTRVGWSGPNSDQPYDVPKRGVDGQRLHEEPTATAAKRGAKLKSRHEEEAQKHALAQIAPPEAHDAPNPGAGHDDEGSVPDGNTQAGDVAPDVDEDCGEGAAAEGGEAQQKPAKAKVLRTERAGESGPSPSSREKLPPPSSYLYECLRRDVVLRRPADPPACPRVGNPWRRGVAQKATPPHSHRRLRQ